MLAAAERARKQAEAERDELSEELASNSGKWVFYVININGRNTLRHKHIYFLQRDLLISGIFKQPLSVILWAP